MKVKFTTGITIEGPNHVDISQPVEWPDHEAARFVVRGMAVAIEPSAEQSAAIDAAQAEMQPPVVEPQPEGVAEPQAERVEEAPPSEPQPEQSAASSQEPGASS